MIPYKMELFRLAKHLQCNISLQGGTTLTKNQIGNADKKRDLTYSNNYPNQMNKSLFIRNFKLVVACHNRKYGERKTI